MRSRRLPVLAAVGGLVAVVVLGGTMHGSDEVGADALMSAALVSPAEVAAEVEHGRRTLAPSQRRALADGRVSRSEVLRARADAMACVRDRTQAMLDKDGSASFVVEAEPTDGYDFTFTTSLRSVDGGPIELPSEFDGASNPAISECSAEHLDGVSRIHKLQLKSDAAAVRTAAAQLLECSGAVGVPPGTVLALVRGLEQGAAPPAGAVRALERLDSSALDGFADCMARFPVISDRP